MSLKFPIKCTCDTCKIEFESTLYRTIWGEFKENRDLVFTDKINIVTCPSCKKSFKVPFSLFYTNVVKNFAVWWEPVYDTYIDNEVIEYGKENGEGNFYQTAPRIRDWEEFKKTIIKFENGELRGNPISRIKGKLIEEHNSQLLQKSSSNKGCLILLSIFIFVLVGITL